MVDVMTAFKYMKLAKTVGDYSFFVRRIYTLMYENSESKYDYMKSAIETIKAIRKYVDELFATVEGLSVKDSLTLIEEYKRLLMDFFGVLCEAHFVLERYNERARWVIMPSGLLAARLL